MLYIFCGFIYGLAIPFLARRIGKLMPATMGYILLKLLVPTQSVAREKLEANTTSITEIGKALGLNVGQTISNYMVEDRDSIFFEFDKAFGIEGDTYIKISKEGLLTASNAIISGTIYATDGVFTGTIYANSGYIGKLALSDGRLYSIS